MPGEAKRAFLALAPEGHGSYLVTDIPVHAGCHGHSGQHVTWVPDHRINKVLADLVLDEILD